MTSTILITGGAGFIGSHLADELLRTGWHVRALDNLDPQVHETRERPDYLHRDVELLVGDVRDADAVRRALAGVDAVVHLAARVGVGQSMYDIAGYTSVNNGGTAVLLQALLDRPVKQLVVASSMSVYGEGKYADADGQRVATAERTREQLARGDWDPAGEDGTPLTPVPTPEDKPTCLSSIYALNKYDQSGCACCSARPTRCRSPRCASSTSTARARRFRTRTPACWRSSRAVCSTTARR